jgi:hypothetical protein
MQRPEAAEGEQRDGDCERRNPDEGGAIQREIASFQIVLVRHAANDWNESGSKQRDGQRAAAVDRQRAAAERPMQTL